MLKLIAAFAVITVASAGGAVSNAAADAEADGLPAGLAAFLEGRLLEGENRFREAVDAYERAMAADPSVVEVRIGYGDLLLRLGRPDRAVELLDGVEGLDWHGRRVLALALAQLSTTQPARMEAARAALEAVLDERDDDPNLLLAYGQLLHRMGRIDEAESAIAELRQNRPGSPQLISYHAALLLQLGRKEEAAELFTDCAASPSMRLQCRDSAVELLIDLGRPGDAADVLLATLGDDELDLLMRAAYLLWEADRPGQSLEVVERVLGQDRSSVPARTLRAHLLTSVGRFDDASAEFRSLLKKNPGDTDLQLAMAWALARQGDIDEARRWLDRAWEPLAANPTSPDAIRCAVTGARVELVTDNPIVARDWLARVADPAEAGEEFVRLLGESFRREEDWRGGIGAMVRIQPGLNGEARLAAEAIEAEFRLRASDPRAWQRLRPLVDSDDLTAVLMGLQVLQATERWADAERESAAALDRFPAERQLLFGRAAALERLGRFDEAETAFLALLESDPADASAANYLGYLWADRGVNLDQALELITLAVAAEPENPAYLDSLGWVHYRLGSLEQAEYWLRRAVELNDTDGTVLAHLGEVLVARGAIEDGRRYLQLALDLGCEHPDQVRDLLDDLDDGLPQ
jgi:predicted Zn-dependent protease